MNQRDLPFDQTVADRIQALLARCDRIKRGSDMRPVTFDARGEQHARAVAEADGGGQKLTGPPTTTPGSVA